MSSIRRWPARLLPTMLICRGFDSSLHIFTTCNCFEMLWVYAALYTTKMIGVSTRGNRTLEIFIGKTVSQNILLSWFIPINAIPHYSSQTSKPYPTPTFWDSDNFFVKRCWKVKKIHDVLCRYFGGGVLTRSKPGGGNFWKSASASCSIWSGSEKSAAWRTILREAAPIMLSFIISSARR